MIMKHSFLFYDLVGTFIQLQMNFGMHFMILLTNVKYKQKLKLMQYCCGTDTGTKVDIHGILKTKCFRSTANIESLLEITKSAQITCSLKIPPLTLKIRHKVEVNTSSWS